MKSLPSNAASNPEPYRELMWHLISNEKEWQRALSTLRPGCIYYRLIVAEEVLWRGVLSLLRAEGLGDVREHVYLSDFIRTTRRRLLLRS